MVGKCTYCGGEREIPGFFGICTGATGGVVSIFSEFIVAILNHPSNLSGSTGNALNIYGICTGDTGDLLSIFRG